ncbi:unnamed protein product [Schistosoma curassoni]|nr:unnamed protein product [Schistosoma curassoni]
MSVKVDIQSSNFCRINDESDQHKQLIPEDTISTVYNEQPNVKLDDNEKLANDSSDSLHEVLDDLNKFNDELKKSFNDSFSIDLSNLPYPPGYSIIKQNDSMINCENQYKESNEIEQENSKEPRYLYIV